MRRSILGAASCAIAAAITACGLLATFMGPASAREDAREGTREAIPVQYRTITLDELPRQAVETLQLIMEGGPFPHRQDGSVFGNFERRLPPQPRGYYHEYTVKTPRSRDRGARRIIAGGNPRAQGEFYYSDDHYESFRRIVRETPQ